MPQITKAEQAVVDALRQGVTGLKPEALVTVKAGDVATLCKLVKRANFEAAPEPTDEGE
jgi:hypothetical protein